MSFLKSKKSCTTCPSRSNLGNAQKKSIFLMGGVPLPHLYFYAVLLSAHWPKIDLGKGHISFVALILYQALNVSFESFLNAEWLPFITKNKTKQKFKTKTVATGFYSEKRHTTPSSLTFL